MLILCIGPDTFRAQQKARELEAAFKTKYDPSGSSVEHLSPGKDGVEEVIERANTVSLFSPRRFLYTLDLLSECPKAKQVALAKALAKDPENVIVVSVEAEPPSSAVLKIFPKETKIIKYEFPEQSGSTFVQWVASCAKFLRVDDEQAIHQIAEATDGDSWWAFNELLKVAAGGTSDVAVSHAKFGLYDYTDAYLKQSVDRFSFLDDEDMITQILTPLLSQTRAALRVRDRSTDGLHPYMVKKLQKQKFENLEKVFGTTLLTFFMQRAGYGSDDEVVALL